VLIAAGLVTAGATGPEVATAANVNPGDLPASATWLEALNAWRSASDLTLVTEDTSTTPTWSEGAAKHSEYIVKTGTLVHAEDALSPFFTAEGDAAGQNGNVAASTNAAKTQKEFVEQWITAPFHAAGMLDPRLETSGFGTFSDEAATPYKSAATLDVVRGRSVNPATTTTVFPGDGSTLPIATQSYRGGESPDPLSHCPGYDPGGGAPINTGTPLFALLPEAPTAGTLIATVTRDGAPVEACAYDETSYTNADPDAQQLGRDVLASRHQVVIVPRFPLAQGATYEVSVSVVFAGDPDPTVTMWDFITEAQPRVSIGNASVVEGNLRARQVRFTATLSRPHYLPVTVDYATVAGTATAGTDFVAKSGTITFAPGVNSAVVWVLVKGDRTPEPQESFTVRLADPTNAKRGRRTGTASIISDDSPTNPAPKISIGSASLVEGESARRALRFAVTLSSASQQEVEVDWHTVDGTADAATDYAEAHGQLTIPARAVSAVVLVRIRPDLVDEPNELFTVRLSDPEGAAIHRAVGTGTVIDDD
jgi:uncharacterized protein YkwD